MLQTMASKSVALILRQDKMIMTGLLIMPNGEIKVVQNLPRPFSRK